MSLGPFGIAIKALRGGRNGAAVAAVCRTESSHFTAGGLGGRGRTEEAAVAVAGFHHLSALLECSAALLARLRAQPALLEGFVTLLALPA